MSDVDELIARLAAEGELDGTGNFTLDPAAALAKLREHQLGDPTRFVLGWVRAAVLLGASAIDIEIDADDVRLSFDGEPWTAVELDQLWAAAVGKTGSPRARAARELAIGINGVFLWGAKRVTVLTGSSCVELDRQLEMRRTELPEPSPRNVIHAKRPLGWDLIRRLLLDDRGQLPEELLLATACAHSRVPITLEGRRLDRDWTACMDPWIRVEIDEDGRRGLLVLREGKPSRLRVLIAGVEVAELELPYPHGYVEAVVDDPLLPLDLSQEKPVAGERWAELLDCVDRARWRAWFELAAREDGSGSRRQALLDDILACPDLRWTAAPGAMELAARIPCEGALYNPSGGFRELRDKRELLQPFPPPKLESPTLAEVVAQIRERGGVYTSKTSRWDLPIIPGVFVLDLEPPAGSTLWRPLERPEHLIEYFEAAQQRPLAGDQLTRRWPSLQFTHDDLQIRVAWLRDVEGEQGALIVGREGKRLGEFRLPSRWGPLWAEVEAWFVAEPELALDEQLARAVLAILSRFHELMLVIAEQPEGDELERVRSYLREASGRWSARRLAECTQIPAEARALAIASWRGDWGVPADWSSPPDDGATTEHPIARIGWLPQGDRLASFAELRAARPLRWIDRDDPLASELPPEIWRLDANERRLIASLLPAALEPFDRHAWARRHPGVRIPPAALDGAHSSLRFHGQAGERGILAVPEREVPRDWSHPARRSARLRLLVTGHELGWIDVPLPIGPFYGVIEVPDARPLPHTDVAAKDHAWRAAAAVIEAAALELARAELQAWIIDCRLDHDLARAREWLLDLERGGWPEFAAELQAWHRSLPSDHPLRVDPRAGAASS